VYIPAFHKNASAHDISWFLGQIAPCWKLKGRVILDFSRCVFLSAEGAALIASAILRRAEDGARTDVDRSTIGPKILRQLRRWGMSRSLGIGDSCAPDTAIPMLHQREKMPVELVQYVERNVQVGQRMPQMSPPLAKEVRKAFCELFLNVFEHADSPIGGLTLGQYYPTVNEVQVCICDAGLRLATQVLQSKAGPKVASDAVTWALRRGTTTRAGRPGGLGLYLLTELVKINGGTMRIIANGSFLSQSGAGTAVETLSNEFPGTCFQVKFLLRDDVVYHLV